MGAAASMQRPDIGHLSVQSALDQGYDMETIRLIKTQLEKHKDASDLQTRDGRATSARSQHERTLVNKKQSHDERQGDTFVIICLCDCWHMHRNIELLRRG